MDIVRRNIDPVMVRVLDYWTVDRGKVVQEVDCPACGLPDVEVHEDDIVAGSLTRYTTVCPNILCGTTITWTDEGDG